MCLRTDVILPIKITVLFIGEDCVRLKELLHQEQTIRTRANNRDHTSKQISHKATQSKASSQSKHTFLSIKFKQQLVQESVCDLLHWWSNNTKLHIVSISAVCLSDCFYSDYICCYRIMLIGITLLPAVDSWILNAKGPNICHWRAGFSNMGRYFPTTAAEKSADKQICASCESLTCNYNL